MTHCREDKSRLDGYVDGTLTGPGRVEVEAHLAACPECRAEVLDLRSLLAAARGLPRSVEPARDLWAGIEARLPAAGRLEPARERGRPSRWLRTVVGMAAALALMAGGGLLATWWQSREGLSGWELERARYQQAAAQLASDLATNRGGLSDETRQVLERNLRIIDDAIREAEGALTSDPGNAALAGMLLARYEQRIELLQRATAAVQPES